MPPSAYLGRLACVRCQTEVTEDRAVGGCARCASTGDPANVLPLYDLDRLAAGTVPVEAAEPGLFRYRPLLPVGETARAVSLAEGGTPLLRTGRLGATLGVADLHVKDESRNPTWSYKDRLAALVVTKAVEAGQDTVVVATTGNHGAAVAAYAAAAGLRCVVLTLESVPLTMKVLMQSYGARVVALRRGPDRWALMERAVVAYGWVPASGYRNPPAGSNPFGVDAYKTIAYELVEQLGRAPDVVVVPTAYADGLAGIERGFQDLVGLGVIPDAPRMAAAEPFGPYAEALASGADRAGPVEAGPSVAFSTATPVGTHQGLLALRRSGGMAVAVGDDDTVMRAQALAARTEGLYLEAASALSFAAIGKLVEGGQIGGDETVVAVGTSTGLKDTGASATRLPEVPVIEPSLPALDAALMEGAG